VAFLEYLPIVLAVIAIILRFTLFRPRRRRPHSKK
jgi:hypothetical protein